MIVFGVVGEPTAPKHINLTNSSESDWNGSQRLHGMQVAHGDLAAECEFSDFSTYIRIAVSRSRGIESPARCDASLPFLSGS